MLTFRPPSVVFGRTETDRIGGIGPIVRINPWEVHIKDPDFWDVLYTNNKLDKDVWYYRCFGDNRGTVGTGPWELHRRRRAAMAKFFSTANVARLEPMVLSRVKKLLDRIQEHRKSGKPIPISCAFRAFTTDVISDYAAPHSRDFLSTPDFELAFTRQLRDFSNIMLWHRHFPIVFPVFNAIPRWLIEKLDPSGAQKAVLANLDDIRKQATTVISTKGNPPGKSSPTVLDAIYKSDSLGPEEKTLPRFLAETQALLGAGTETTGNALSVFTYHVLANPSIYQRLKAELREAAQNSSSELLDTKVLDKLPYLQACIKEVLRVAIGVVGRLPRVNRLAPISYTDPNGKTYTFPPGTVVSMSIRDMHLDENIFPDPHAFNPDRWLSSSPEQLKRMEKSFVPFNRGIRACLGLELAKEEILLVTGNLFHHYDLELYETTERDIAVMHEFFAPFGPRDSMGVQVIAR